MFLIKILISLGLLLLLTLLVSRSINLTNLLETLANFPLETLLAVFAISFSITIIKTWRFLFLLRNIGITTSFWETLKSFVASQAITPLPGGETMRSVLVHKETGAKMHNISGAVISQAYIELFSAALVMLIGSFVFHLFVIPSLIVIFLLSLLALFMVNTTVFSFVTGKLPKWKFLKKLPESHLSIKRNFYDVSSGLPDKDLIRSLTLSIFAHILGGFLIFLIAQSLNLELDFFRSMFIYSSSIVIQGLVSFIPGGLGFTESGMTGLLVLSQIELTSAVSVVLIFRMATLVFNILLGLIFLLVFYSKHLFVRKVLK